MTDGDRREAAASGVTLRESEAGRAGRGPGDTDGHVAGGDHVHKHEHAHDHSDGVQACCCGHDHSVAGRPAFDETALLSARGLALGYNGKPVLSDIDFDIREGEIVTVIGPNGAGKSTLVRVLLGLVKPEGGSVRRRRDARIGYVPQRLEIDAAIPMTVERFLSLGEGVSKSAIADSLKEVGASHTFGRQVSKLSGGELQRVVLARALLREPNLLVLDEPVRGVDYAGEAELYNLFARLRDTRGLGVLLVSHDLHVVMASSDRVVCLNQHVCCSGVPETVAQHPEYVRLFGADAARSFALYHHHHDHRHGPAGEPLGDGQGTGASHA
jgi:zinc transport system ATP-binding protein